MSAFPWFTGWNVRLGTIHGHWLFLGAFAGWLFLCADEILLASAGKSALTIDGWILLRDIFRILAWMAMLAWALRAYVRSHQHLDGTTL